MKKLVFALAALFSISMFSCTGGQQENNPSDNDSIDTTVVVADTAIHEVTGVAVDGANNSISLLVGGDTVSFEYPDLDRDHRDSWYINDTVTVRYYVTHDGDSVTDVVNEVEA